MQLSNLMKMIAEGRGRPKIGTSVEHTTRSLHKRIGRFSSKTPKVEATNYKKGGVKSASVSYNTKKRTGAVHRHLIRNGFKLSSSHTHRNGTVSHTYVHPTSNVAVHHTYNKNAKGELRRGALSVYKARPRTKKSASKKKA